MGLHSASNEGGWPVLRVPMAWTLFGPGSFGEGCEDHAENAEPPLSDGGKPPRPKPREAPAAGSTAQRKSRRARRERIGGRVNGCSWGTASHARKGMKGSVEGRGGGIARATALGLACRSSEHIPKSQHARLEQHVGGWWSRSTTAAPWRGGAGSSGASWRLESRGTRGRMRRAREARLLARREGTTLRALVEEGLRRVVRERRATAGFQLRGRRSRATASPPSWRAGAGSRSAGAPTRHAAGDRHHGVAELCSADRDFGRFPRPERSHPTGRLRT
jgi:hypothetical protein